MGVEMAKRGMVATDDEGVINRVLDDLRSLRGLQGEARYQEDSLAVASSYIRGMGVWDALDRLRNTDHVFEDTRVAQWFLHAVWVAARQGLNREDLKFLLDNLKGVDPDREDVGLRAVVGGSVKDARKAQVTANILERLWEVQESQRLIFFIGQTEEGGPEWQVNRLSASVQLAFLEIDLYALASDVPFEERVELSAWQKEVVRSLLASVEGVFDAGLLLRLEQLGEEVFISQNISSEISDMRRFVKAERLMEELTNIVFSIVALSRSKAVAEADEAMKNPGGIDFNPLKMRLDVSSQGDGAALSLDPAVVRSFQQGDFSGLEGQILQIRPLLDLRSFLEPIPVSVL